MLVNQTLVRNRCRNQALVLPMAKADRAAVMQSQLMQIARYETVRLPTGSTISLRASRQLAS